MNRTRMRGRSAKRTAMDYASFVRMRLAEHPSCEVGPILESADPLWRCDAAFGTGRPSGRPRRAEGLHHLRKRSSAGAIVCRLNTLTCCNLCNGRIEQVPALAREAGLVLREGDDGWAERGARYHHDHHEGTN